MNLRQAIAAAMAEMFPVKIKLDAANGTGYDDEWTVKVTGGTILHKIQLNTNLVNRNTLKRISIDIGGDEVAYASGAYLEFYRKAFEKQETAGIFELDLSKFHYRTPAGIYQTMLVTYPHDDITIKVKFGERHTVGNDAASHDPAQLTLRATALASDNIYGLRRMVEPRKYEVTAYCSAAEEFEWTFPSGNIDKKLQQITFDESQVNISKVVVKRGKKELMEWTRKELDHDLLENEIKPQPKKCLVDFTLLGFGTKGISTNDLKFTLTTDSAGSIKTYIDGYEQVEKPQPQPQG